MELFELLWNPWSSHLLISAGLGVSIGVERELAGKDPGIRTFTLISLGSCLFTMLSVSSAMGIPNAEPSRIAAQIIPGIGFLGAGAIFRSHQRVGGLTTAALMWVTAAIGMAVGFDQLALAVQATFITVALVLLLNGVRKVLHKLAE